MDRRSRPSDPRRAAALAALCAVLLPGCGGHTNVQFSSVGSPSTGVSSGGSVQVQGSSTLGTLFAIGILAGASIQSDRDMGRLGSPAQRVPELDPARRVVEQDCTKPIVDWSANLKCR